MRQPSLLVACVVLCAACPASTTAGDASDAGDASETAANDTGVCTESTPLHSIYPGPLYVRVGSTSAARLRLSLDRSACAAEYTLRIENGAVADAPTTVRVEPTHGQVEFTVTGRMAGRTRITATQSQPPTTAPVTASTDIVVLAADLAACPTTTPEVSGHLVAGARIVGAVGTPLAPASISLQMAATEVPAVDVTIACAADQVPMDFDALGPAIAFGPGATRFAREVPFTVPVNPARVPSMYELQAELAYTGPGAATPRIVPVANARFTSDGRALSFLAMRLGTYQAVIRRGLGTRRVQRHMTYRAILGISMGAVGSSMIGTRHPDLFDAILPLGGPADSGFSGDYLHRFVFGGFCTEAQRMTLGDAMCASSATARVPVANDIGVAVQHFEVFFSPPGRGTGGTFDRRARFQGFRDIAHMFGNPIMYADPANGILPFGVPAGELTRTDTDRCATPVVLGGGADTNRLFYDDEFNPAGVFPVMTFCDGPSAPGEPGRWVPGPGNYPVEIALAVDRNRNGTRDPGEPVIRNFSEPFRDVGLDGVPSTMEAGYDARTNPDPAGDDYDRQYNPAGLEGNFLHDMGEPYDDLGLDGVACPAGRMCPYDFGEGNGQFDAPGGGDQSSARNPRVLYAALPAAEAHRLGVWADGGVRDALQFGVNANHFVGAVAQRNVGLHYFDGFHSLITGRDIPLNTDVGFVPYDVDYEHLPAHSMLRYGFVDASMQQILDGDGAHVGTSDQITSRIQSAAWWMQSRWPNGDRRIMPYVAQPDNAGRCANGYFCSFEFRSDRANRTGPVSVYLPPGYHRPENRAVTYPVLYVLHGYGMQPQDLLGLGFVIGTFMSSGQIAEWQRPAKFIMVFPDGRCRPGDGCLEGTFYVDSPIGNARMETYFLELNEWVSRTYRARPPGDVDVVE